ITDRHCAARRPAQHHQKKSYGKNGQQRNNGKQTGGHAISLEFSTSETPWTRQKTARDSECNEAGVVFVQEGARIKQAFGAHKHVAPIPCGCSTCASRTCRTRIT